MKLLNSFTLTNSPLSQFEITELFNFNILNFVNLNLTNIGFYLTIAGSIVLILSILATNNQKLIANN
jgi:F0F1-type ATP synthase membrane subunit a